MNGSFMLVAFILGFWCIWSANREVNSPMESLGITIVAVVAKALMEWGGLPEFTPALLTTWGILFVYTLACLELIGRYSSNMTMNLVMAISAASGWFFLAQWLFSPAGAAKVAGWIA